MTAKTLINTVNPILADEILIFIMNLQIILNGANPIWQAKS